MKTPTLCGHKPPGRIRLPPSEAVAADAAGVARRALAESVGERAAAAADPGLRAAANHLRTAIEFHLRAGPIVAELLAADEARGLPGRYLTRSRQVAGLMAAAGRRQSP